MLNTYLRSSLDLYSSMFLHSLYSTILVLMVPWTSKHSSDPVSPSAFPRTMSFTYKVQRPPTQPPTAERRSEGPHASPHSSSRSKGVLLGDR